MALRPDDFDLLLSAIRAVARRRFGQRAVRAVISLSDGETCVLPIPEELRRPEGEDAPPETTSTPRESDPSEPVWRRVATHSPDFRSINWFGTTYSFTDLQSRVVALLWLAWQQGTPDVGANTLLVQAGSAGERVIDLFRRHPAWGTVITSGETNGSYRLTEPRPN